MTRLSAASATLPARVASKRACSAIDAEDCEDEEAEEAEGVGHTCAQDGAGDQVEHCKHNHLLVVRSGAAGGDAEDLKTHGELQRQGKEMGA